MKNLLNRLKPAVNFELMVHPANVTPHGVDADAQILRDFLVTEPRGKPFHYLVFTAAQIPIVGSEFSRSVPNILQVPAELNHLAESFAANHRAARRNFVYRLHNLLRSGSMFEVSRCSAPEQPANFHTVKSFTQRDYFNRGAVVLQTLYHLSPLRLIVFDVQQYNTEALLHFSLDVGIV